MRPLQTTLKVSALVSAVPDGMAVPQLKFTVASVRVVLSVVNVLVS